MANTHNNSNDHNKDDRRLYYLHELKKYRVAKGDPDVRGWEVVDSDQKRIGHIDNLLVDIHNEKVRYLDVDLDDKFQSDHPPVGTKHDKGVHDTIKKDGSHHLMIPIGAARIQHDHHNGHDHKHDRDHDRHRGHDREVDYDHKRGNTVLVDAIDRDKLTSAPRFEKNQTITPTIEADLSERYIGPRNDAGASRAPHAYPADESIVNKHYYDNDLYDESRFYNRKQRLHETGEEERKHSGEHSSQGNRGL